METTPSEFKEVVIAAEDAVFWMDENGQWRNRHGRFEHKKIINYFNAAIGKDDNGFFVEHINGSVREKVYFRYNETALFAIALKPGPPPVLILNTGKRAALAVDRMFIVKDRLYHRWEDHFIKFSDHLLLRMADDLDFREGAYFFRLDRKWHPIAVFESLDEALHSAGAK